MEAKYQALQRKLSEEVEKRRKVEQASDNLCEDVERAKCASVDLMKRLEACRTAYDTESLKVDELQAAAEEKKLEYQSELAIESHNRLWLCEIEHRAAELIERSGRRHRRLFKKLESNFTKSHDAVANLEVELANVLKRLGLEQRLEGAATADSGGVGHVWCSYRNK
ncbi:hypothetical protein AXG93_3101s1000 [Marchantia polymorpha subsp. ruderalis]|uniref:Uncharacterized protein n=1 Tax=Marchantia polymorpha subsp. ruderalis TaxID=1480154 RepID=A0A176W380_MARPO|nr:hypothetical protein AXG93_3101s1000 [Marchantia polymorpha subsp. ruderalis]